MSGRSARCWLRAIGSLVIGAGATLLVAQGAGVQEVSPPAQNGTHAAPGGEQLFIEKGCSYCHGPSAAGTDKGPSLLTIGSRWSKLKIEQQIREGGQSMPAFGDALEPEELATLVDYLAAKRGPAAKAGHKPAKGNHEE